MHATWTKNNAELTIFSFSALPPLHSIHLSKYIGVEWVDAIESQSIFHCNESFAHVIFISLLAGYVMSIVS